MCFVSGWNIFHSCRIPFEFIGKEVLAHFDGHHGNFPRSSSMLFYFLFGNIFAMVFWSFKKTYMDRLSRLQNKDQMRANAKSTATLNVVWNELGEPRREKKDVRLKKNNNSVHLRECKEKKLMNEKKDGLWIERMNEHPIALAIHQKTTFKLVMYSLMLLTILIYTFYNIFNKNHSLSLWVCVQKSIVRRSAFKLPMIFQYFIPRNISKVVTVSSVHWIMLFIFLQIQCIKPLKAIFAPFFLVILPKKIRLCFVSWQSDEEFFSTFVLIRCNYDDFSMDFMQFFTWISEKKVEMDTNWKVCPQNEMKNW